MKSLISFGPLAHMPESRERRSHLSHSRTKSCTFFREETIMTLCSKFKFYQSLGSEGVDKGPV